MNSFREMQHIYEWTQAQTIADPVNKGFGGTESKHSYPKGLHTASTGYPSTIQVPTENEEHKASEERKASSGYISKNNLLEFINNKVNDSDERVKDPIIFDIIAYIHAN